MLNFRARLQQSFRCSFFSICSLSWSVRGAFGWTGTDDDASLLVAIGMIRSLEERSLLVSVSAVYTRPIKAPNHRQSLNRKIACMCTYTYMQGRPSPLSL